MYFVLVPCDVVKCCVVASYCLELWGVLSCGVFSCLSSRCFSFCFYCLWIRFSFQFCHGYPVGQIWQVLILSGSGTAFLPLVMAHFPCNTKEGLFFSSLTFLMTMLPSSGSFHSLCHEISFLSCLLCSALTLWIQCSFRVQYKTCLALLCDFTLCLRKIKKKLKSLEVDGKSSFTTACEN